MTELFHPVANIFPLIEGREFEEFVEDVRTNGLREPIVMYEGMILDGRNRYRACVAANVELRKTEYDSDDPIGYVISLNLRRRHLDTTQRAQVADRIATLKEGRPSTTAQICAVSQDNAAAMLNVSRRSVQSARVVRESGAPELDALVARGAKDGVAISVAADLATLPISEQREIIARGEKEIVAAAKAIRAEKADERRSERVARIEQIAAGNVELPTGRRYPIIYADPPWRYENPPMGDTDRSIENHYPTMTIEEICAVPVREIAADDCLLYLWATAPKLLECLRVMDFWGFSYRTHIIWVKDKIGMGYHARSKHELLLIGKRGNMPPPRPGEQPYSVIEAPRGQHSEKPDVFAEEIERMYPDVGRIELFSRSPRKGWAAWGNQANVAA